VPFKDLCEFLSFRKNDLARVKVEVPHMGNQWYNKNFWMSMVPAVLFEKVKGSGIPLLCNLFGTGKIVSFSPLTS